MQNIEKLQLIFDLDIQLYRSSLSLIYIHGFQIILQQLTVNICNYMDWINRADLRFYSRWTEIVTDLSDGGRLHRQDSASKEFVFCDLPKGEFHEFFTGEPSFVKFSKSGFPVIGA